MYLKYQNDVWTEPIVIYEKFGKRRQPYRLSPDYLFENEDGWY